MNNPIIQLPVYEPAGRDVVLSETDLLQHMLVIGATGSGKSCLLHRMLEQLIHHPDRPGLLICDAKGDDTVTRVRKMSLAAGRDDVVVLGRDRERPGALCSTLSVQVDDEPVLLTSIDTSLPGWSGPAGTGGARVLANRLHLTDDPGTPFAVPSSVDGTPNTALLDVSSGCRLAVAAADEVHTARSYLDAVLPL